MDWIADNLKLIIFVVVIVVYALKAMREKSEADRGRNEEPRHMLPGEEDAAEAERTRQIQEEIRRRILARQRGEDPDAVPPPIVIEETAPPPVLAPRPVATEEDPWARPVATPPPIPAPAPVPAPMPVFEDEEEAAAARTRAMIERQRALEEQLRQMRAAREAAFAGVPALAHSAVGGASRVAHGARSVRRALRDDLSGRGSLRRAIVLREVLGEPVALRTGPAGLTRR